jgi:hypothetical protein
MAQILRSSSPEWVQSADDPLRDLPLPGERHWLPRHKAAVVAAVRSKVLSLEEASERYRLTAEEFLSWKAAIDQKGIKGLNASPRERAERRGRSFRNRARQRYTQARKLTV